LYLRYGKVRKKKRKINMRAKDKRAWIRIVEAIIAILVMLTLLIVGLARIKVKQPRPQAKVSELLHFALEQVADNESLREVLNEAASDKGAMKQVEQWVSSFLPASLHVNCSMVEVDETCLLSRRLSSEEMEQVDQVWTDSIIVAVKTVNNGETWQPKKLCCFAYLLKS